MIARDAASSFKSFCGFDCFNRLQMVKYHLEFLDLSKTAKAIIVKEH